MRDRPSMPTVKFDAARVTDEVAEDLLRNILALEDVSSEHSDSVYDAAMRAISVGGDLSALSQALVGIVGMSHRRAAAVSTALWFKASALMDRDRRRGLGIESARWRYSGAPCAARDDASHRAADGKAFPIDKGLQLNGRWTLPGREDGCRCISSPIIKGLEHLDDRNHTHGSGGTQPGHRALGRSQRCAGVR